VTSPQFHHVLDEVVQGGLVLELGSDALLAALKDVKKLETEDGSFKNILGSRM